MGNPYMRVLFAIGDRLHMSVREVERMSRRELQGWIDFFAAQRAENDSDADAVDLKNLSPLARRAMFRH